MIIVTNWLIDKIVTALISNISVTICWSVSYDLSIVLLNVRSLRQSVHCRMAPSYTWGCITSPMMSRSEYRDGMITCGQGKDQVKQQCSSSLIKHRNESILLTNSYFLEVSNNYRHDAVLIFIPDNLYYTAKINRSEPVDLK